MDIDLDENGDGEEDSWGWEGGGAHNYDILGSLLDECLAVG